MKAFSWDIIIVLFIIFPFSSAFGEELFDTKASNKTFQEGLADYYQSNYQSAIEKFKTAISINPENVKAHYYLGYTHYKIRDFAEAFKQFELAYQMNTEYTPIPPSAQDGAFSFQ